MGVKRLRPYLNDGCLELDNNTAERSMRPMALGTKNDRFMGSEHGGKSAAIADIPIEAARLGGYPVRGPSYRTSNASGPEAPRNPPA
jgi:hypothetical protein